MRLQCPRTVCITTDIRESIAGLHCDASVVHQTLDIAQRSFAVKARHLIAMISQNGLFINLYVIVRPTLLYARPHNHSNHRYVYTWIRCHEERYTEHHGQIQADAARRFEESTILFPSAQFPSSTPSHSPILIPHCPTSFTYPWHFFPYTTRFIVYFHPFFSFHALTPKIQLPNLGVL